MKVPKPRKLSSGNYFIQLRFEGESVPITAPTERECVIKAELEKSKHRAGLRAKSTRGVDMSVGQAIDTHIATIEASGSPATAKGYNNVRKNRFKNIMGKKIKDVSDWQSIINSEAKLCAPKTLKNAWSLLRTSVKTASGIILPEVKLPSVPQNPHPFLDYEEIPVFLEAIKGDKAELGALILLHSFRLSEACAMEWETHINLKKRLIKSSGALVQGKDNKYVLKQTNKNKTSQRYVPIMIDRLYELLEASENKAGKIITMAPETLQRRIDRACEAAELPKVGAHGLRHSFASLAYHLNMPEKVTMEIGGWSDEKTMRNIYTHIAQQDVARYQNQMSQFYKNANENANDA